MIWKAAALAKPMAATRIALEREAKFPRLRPEAGRGAKTGERRFFVLSLAGALGLHAALLALFLLDQRPRDSRAVETIPVAVVLAKPAEPAPEASGAGREAVPRPPEPAMSSDGELAEQTRMEQFRALPLPGKRTLQEKDRSRNRKISEAERSKAPSRNGTPLPFRQDSSPLRASEVPLPRAGGDDPISYKRIILGRLAKAKRFPPGARSRGARGIAVVGFRLGEAGELAGVALLRSSGEADLDKESLALIARAAPFPSPPAGAQRDFAVDIAFGMGR